MRIDITFKPNSQKYYMPFNYNYQLSSALYNVFRSGSPEFSAWLHDKGWIDETNKPLKLFTFSKLYFDKVSKQGPFLECEGNAKLLFSSPIEDSLITHFVSGLMEDNNFELNYVNMQAKFKVRDVKIIPEPKMQTKQKFLMLSPAAASKTIEKDGKLHIYYLKPSDPELLPSLKNNLIRKYKLIHNKDYTGKLDIELDQDYIKSRGGEEKISKLITIQEGSNKQNKVKGFVCPLTIEADPDMLAAAYNCGIGQKNSMGFGMLDVR